MGKLLAFVLFSAFAGLCVALNMSQILELIELNSMFDVVHKNYDNQINLAWSAQKRNMKVLNAQFLSRYGFTLDEVKDKEAEARVAIDAIESEIGDPECPSQARNSLNEAVDVSGVQFAQTINEIMLHFDEISEEVFYPLVEALHYESNSFQWDVLSTVSGKNPVTDMELALQRLHEDYYIIVLLYQNAIESLESEIRYYNSRFNQVRTLVFREFAANRDSFFEMVDLALLQLEACAEFHSRK